jgi:hypothetical protein
MRLARFIAPLALIVAAATTPALAQQATPTPTHREAVRRLMVVTRVREITEQSADAMLKGQLEQMPQLAPVANVLRDFYREQMDWSVLEPEYTRLYLEVFTEPEVRQMIAFYETPLGQMLLAKMPLLMQKTGELTTRRMQAAMPQLMQRLQTAMQQQGVTPADTARSRRP